MSDVQRTSHRHSPATPLLLATLLALFIEGCGRMSSNANQPSSPSSESGVSAEGTATNKGLTESEVREIYQGVIARFYADQGANRSSYALNDDAYAAYAIDDLDGNGIPELLIGFPSESNAYGAILLGVWSVDPQTKSPVLLHEGRYRDELHVLADGTLYEHGSSSAWESESQLFYVQGTELVRTMDLVSTGSPDTAITWTYTNIEDDIMNQQVDEQTAYDLMHSYAMGRQLDWTTI